MFLCRCWRSKVGGMGFLKLISQAFPRPLPQSPLVFFLLFRSLYFLLALHLLNAWNRLGFHMIATIAAIAGKNVKQSLRLCGNHFLAIVEITTFIWKPTYMETAQRLKSQCRSTFFIAIVAIIWKLAFKHT